jgi:hypothetical protein
MRHVDLLLPHPEPVVVLMAPRMRNTGRDYDLLEYFIFDLRALGRPVTFRVSGMITGPEEFVETLAPQYGHRVEVYGPGPEEPADRVHRLNKSDDRERDVTCLLGAHALWVWSLTSQLDPSSTLLDYEVITVAQDLQVPVLLFTPESENYDILEI